MTTLSNQLQVAFLAACCNAALQSVFDDLKKELQLRSVANGEFDSEHMETGVLMLGEPNSHVNLLVALSCMTMCNQLRSCC